MAKANVILLNSILWNLREITKLADKIKMHCGDVDCVSWRYPLTTCSELEIFKLLQSNRNLDSYTYILELTYDRLLYVCNLIIKYLESIDSLEKFRPGKSVCRPKTLSLASVLYMIWDRIKAQGENLNKTDSAETNQSVNDIDIKTSKSSTCTQSEVSSISVCSCCEMVQNFITQLVLEMEKVLEKQDFTSAISSEREIMKECLTEMTSWSAMSRWLTAILKDFVTISEKAEQATVSSRKLRHRLDSGERHMKTKTELYEGEIQKLNDRLRNCEAKALEMKQEINKLAKEKVQLSGELNAKNLELTAFTSNFEHKIAELKKTYETKLSKQKEKNIKNENEKDLEWKRKLEAECEKRSEVESENKTLTERINKFKEDLDMLSCKMDEEKRTWDARFKELEREIDNLKQENANLNTSVGEKQKVIDEYSGRLMAAYPELHGSPKAKCKVSADPQIDMENQIEANKLRIERLRSENEELQKTLDKISKIKAMKS